MRIGTDKLIVKALHAVEDAAWLAQRGPVDPSFALRFALAYLWAHSGNSDRSSFDQFWKIVTGTGEKESWSDTIANTVRGTTASTALYGIYRAVGVYRSIDMTFYPALQRKRMTERETNREGNHPPKV